MRHRAFLSAFLLASTALAPAITATPVAADSGTRFIASGGSAVLVSRPNGPEGGVQSPEFRADPDEVREGDAGADVQLRRTGGPSVAAATPAGSSTVGTSTRDRSARVLTSFDGLNLRDQRLANGGNQFTIEPPDQGLCASDRALVESTNDVLRVFGPDGSPTTGVIDLNTFYGYAAQFNRTTGVIGPEITDPTCLFDRQTGHFFHLVLTLEVFPDTGDFTGVNHLDLAVSDTTDPAGAWTIYRVDVTDDGTNGTPNHGCAAPPRGGVPNAVRQPTHPNACLGDFPHIGADEHGIYVTTNEYCFFCPATANNPAGFHAAQIYAFDKRALALRQSRVAVTQLDTLGAQNGKPGFTLWPAESPSVADFEYSARGTEYFTSTNAAEEVSGVSNSKGQNRSNQIVVWALSNTRSLRSPTPQLNLRETTVQVDEYAVPGPSNQKPGPFPLGQCINDTTTPTIFGTIGCWSAILLAEPKHHEVEGPLDSSDSRVLSTTFVKNRLYGTLDTSVSVGGKTKAGVQFYVIEPDADDNHLSASLERQGQIAVQNNNVIYGAVAATHTGQAVVGFTLVGDDHYPSSAYVSLNRHDHGNTGDVRIIAEGAAPQDGFTEYGALSPSGTPRPRWGDYGWAQAVDDDTIWVAGEYIAHSCTLSQYMQAPFGSCGGTRVTLGNWSTRVTKLDVSRGGRGGDDDFAD